MTTPSPLATPTSATPPTLSLSTAPTRRAMRLVGLDDAASPDAGTLAALGVRAGEMIYVHKRGEPTIVSVGRDGGRRIGLSVAAARRVRVSLDS